MPTRKRTTIHVEVPPDARAALDAIALSQSGDGRLVVTGDVVRQAIEQYLKAHGYDIPVTVNRGGWRGGPKNKA